MSAERSGVPGGYAGKWLDIDLTKGSVEKITFSRSMLEQYFGGRGMAEDPVGQGG